METSGYIDTYTIYIYIIQIHKCVVIYIYIQLCILMYDYVYRYNIYIYRQYAYFIVSNGQYVRIKHDQISSETEWELYLVI